MGVANWFETFNNSLRFSDETVETISYRYKRITKQLNTDFWNTDSETAHSLYVGSYGRDTDIHVSDVDVLFQLPSSVYERINKYIGNGQSALLQEVRSSLQKTYATTHISGDGQVIKINFDDGVGFEIVPCFLNTNGSFTYPDTNNGGTWKITDPKPEIEALRKMNDECNGNLKPLCRMARSWKDTWSVPIGGLLIDTLAYNFLKDYTYRDRSYLYYDFMSRDFFTYLNNQPGSQEYWLALGSSQKVNKKGNFQYKAVQCYNIALGAIQSETDKYEYTAKSKWREIYGTKFPS